MKIKIILTIFLLSCLISNGQNFQWAWVKSAGDTIGVEQGRGVATDGDGNILVSGIFASYSIVSGNDTLRNADLFSGTNDFFMIKYDPNGNVIWSRSGGGVSNEYVYSMAVDAIGNSYMTGSFMSDTLNIGTTILTNLNGRNFFIVKFDPGGNVLWAKQSHGPDIADGLGVAVDNNLNVYVTGNFMGAPISFDSISVNVSGNFPDIFITKYDSSGNVVWVKAAGSPGNEMVRNIGVDADNNFYITGYASSSSISFDSITLTNTLNIDNIFIAKYDSQGNVRWAKISSEGRAICNGISLDANRNIYLTGWFDDNKLVFDGIQIINHNTSLSEDIFVVKLDSSGNGLWGKGAGGPKDDFGVGIKADANGNSFVTGFFKSDSITFGNQYLQNSNGPTLPTYEIFVVKYDPNGNVLWPALAGGGFSNEITTDITLDLLGNVYITGYVNGISATFGSIVLPNLGASYDMFLAKLNVLTGIDEMFNEDDSKIFPNPSNGFAEIKSDLPIRELVIRNISGQIVYHSNPGENIFSINIINSGVYFITLTTNLKTVTKKLVVWN